MSRLSDLLTQQLEAKLRIQDSQNGTTEGGGTSTATEGASQETNTQTTGTETSVVQQQTTESPLVAALKQSGIALPEGIDDSAAAKQIAELVAANQRRDQELQRLQQEHAQQQERLRQAEIQAAIAAQQQQKPQAQQETATQVAAEAKKWSQIEIDPSLAAICKFDETTRRFVPDPTFGVESQSAAAKLNAHAQEQARRERLLLNDPLAAMSEAGLMDAVKKLVSEEIVGFKGEIQKTIEQRRQEAEQIRAQQEQQMAEAEFFKKHGAEFYQVDATTGQPMIGLDTQPVLTPRGQQFVQRMSELTQQYGNSLRQIDIANLALQMLPPVVNQQQQAQQVAEAKKQNFVDKTRNSQAGPAPSHQMSQREIQEQMVGERSITSGLTRFSDMFLNDPAHKELLASQYGNR